MFQSAQQMKMGPTQPGQPPRAMPPQSQAPGLFSGPPNVNASHLPSEPHFNPRSGIGAHLYG